MDTRNGHLESKTPHCAVPPCTQYQVLLEFGCKFLIEVKKRSQKSEFVTVQQQVNQTEQMTE